MSCLERQGEWGTSGLRHRVSPGRRPEALTQIKKTQANHTSSSMALTRRVDR